MAGKRTGGGTPQGTVGRVARRGTIWGALDNRRTAEQDVREIKFVRPRGSSGAIIVNPGGGQEGYAANLLGKTLRPGTTALALSKSGEGGDNIIPASAVGRKGAIPATPSRRPYATPAAATPNQYAFGVDGLGSMLAMLYSDASYLSTRATTAELTGNPCGCILTDSSEVVGVGSLLFVGSTALYVWDVEGATVYSYAVPGGWTNPTNLYYQNGFLYWVEFEDIPAGGIGSGDSTFDYRLRRANTDLTSVTTITTATSPDATDYGPPYNIYDSDPMVWAFAVDADGAILYIGVALSESTNYEDASEVGLQVRFALAGGAPSVREWSASELGGGTLADGVGLGGYHCATIGGLSFAIEAIYAKADDASGAASSLWPSVSVTRESFNVGTGGSVLQVYGSRTLLRGVASGTLITDAVEAFDSTPTYPFAMYYFGE
jgi:hypothetical protein